MTEFHPTPWRVHYGTQSGWHPKACPCVLDSNGKLVVRPPQHVNHPGGYDAQADEVVQRIVRAVNNSELRNQSAGFLRLVPGVDIEIVIQREGE